MDDRAYQAALVRSLLIPGQLARERAVPGSNMDWDTWGKVAGLITLVRHNFLWEVLPLTRRFLHQARLEIGVFAEWADRHLEMRMSRSSRDEQVRAFVSFLSAYCARRDLAWLQYILLHEHGLWQLREACPDKQGLGIAVSLEGIPCVNGRLVVLELPAAPGELVERAEAVISGRACGEGPTTPRRFVYARNPLSDDVRIAEVDIVHATLLNAIDGRQPAQAIADGVLGSDAAAMALHYFTALTTAGLVRWRVPT